jgi:inorganic pyrophosphatase
MKKALKRMRPFVEGKKYLNVVIETPKGSRVKYAYDFGTGLLKLDRALPEGMVFPFNFGFVPGTKAEDGDPVDILVLNEEPLFPGCQVKAQLVGVILANQTEKGETVRNDRLIGLAIGKETPTSLHSIELDKRAAMEIEQFFVSYNKLAGRKFKVQGRSGHKKAMAIVREYEVKTFHE